MRRGPPRGSVCPGTAETGGGRGGGGINRCRCWRKNNYYYCCCCCSCSYCCCSVDKTAAGAVADDADDDVCKSYRSEWTLVPVSSASCSSYNNVQFTTTDSLIYFLFHETVFLYLPNTWNTLLQQVECTVDNYISYYTNCKAIKLKYQIYFKMRQHKCWIKADYSPFTIQIIYR